MNFAIVIPSWDAIQAQKVVQNLVPHSSPSVVDVVISGANRAQRWGAVEAMAKGAEGVEADVLVFCHDDIEVYEPWAEYLDILFTARPEIGLIGLHGAKGLGSDDIYRTKYRLEQLARTNPCSNMIDAEQHGMRTTVPQEVATVDGFFMAVRKMAYDAVGGWQACLNDGIPYHMYDHWMAMVLREHGYKTYLAPISCKHEGGGTEVKKSEEYKAWAQENGFDGISDVHTEGHKAFYERFRGQLPIRVR